MIEFFYLQLIGFWAWLLPFLQTLLWPGVALLAVVLGARIIAAKSDAPMAAQIDTQAKTWGKVAAILATAGVLATVHRAAMESVGEYRTHQSVKRFDSKEVVAGGAVNQGMPSVKLLETKLVPSSTVISAEEVDNYRTATGVDYARYIKNTRGFDKAEIIGTTPTDKGGVRVAFQYQTITEKPVTLDSSAIDLKLDAVPDADPRANSYALGFKASYQWKNATDEAAVTRFQFTLPDHGGTINDVAVTFDGVTATGSNENGLISYEGKLAPGQMATARVSYNTKGRGNFRFYPSEGLRTIPQLDINLQSTADVRFERGSIVATNLGQGKYRWTLKNAVTRQFVSIAIPYARGTQELWWKLGYMAPLALFAFVAVLLVSGFLSRPLPGILGAVLAQMVGTSLPLAFANFETSPILLGIVGAVISGFAVLVILGRKSWLAVVVSSGLYLAAIAGAGTAGLVLLVLLGLGVAVGLTHGASLDSGIRSSE
ncbi:MAG: hypothetical protein K8R88_14690 [Armatimonadetes bacterium]|nr:hypothetical protein [Armatimonadota bacterium]